MRIALVCGHFIPEMGYLEVHLANALSEQGHDVTVFSSKHIPKYINKYIEGKIDLAQSDMNLPYSVQRFRTSFKLGQMVWGLGLKDALNEYQPAVVIAIGFGKIFPRPIFKGKRNYKIISLFGDNSASFYNYGFLKNALLKTSLKDPVYKEAITNSDRLVFYTPETIGILKENFKDQLKREEVNNSLEITLGFDPKEFYFSSTERKNLRKELNLKSEDQVLITITRVARNKNLEEIICAVDKANQAGKKINYVLIGGSGDEYENEIKNQIKNLKYPHRIRMLPFVNRKDLRKYYNASDYGIWPVAAISIFEAAGTGLPLLLPKQLSLSRVIAPGSGYYFDEGKIFEALVKTIKSNFDRAEIVKENVSKFAYDKLVSKILEGV